MTAENLSQDHDEDLHVLPLGDLREHDCSRGCWCKPTEDDDYSSGVWVHHAMDQRERYESGELRLQ